MSVSNQPVYTLERVRSVAEAGPWTAAFVQAYRSIFAGPPYFEEFTEAEAARALTRLVSVPGNVTLFATTADNELAAFAAAVPLSARPDVMRELTGLIPARHTWYFAELGVLPEHRQKGLGRRLIAERLRLIEAESATHVVMRVAEDDAAARAIYLDMGFADMGVYMEVPGLRTDGRVRTDRRLFLSNVLSQLDLD